MEFSAKQIAEFLKGEVVGNPEVKVSDFAKIEEGRPGTLSFLSNPKYIHYLYSTQADIVLVDKTFEPTESYTATLIKVESAYQSLATLLTLVEEAKPKKRGVHPKAVVSESAQLGEDCYVGAGAYVGEKAIIGNKVHIAPNATVGDGVKIGDNTTLHANVVVYENCKIGSRCMIHAGTVVGSDGFGFAPDEEGHYHKIPQIGNVVIEDDVEIGANTTIDRATMGSTRIAKGVKLDNLIQIAHNVEIGHDTVIAAQSGVAGSTKIGNSCVVGGQVGFVGHLSIASGSKFGAQTGVASSIKEENKIWQGYPALPIMTFRRNTVLMRQFPDIVKKINQLEKK